MIMDRVFIEGLELNAVIGVYPWEREVRQVLMLDLELATDIRPAAVGDDLSRTLDYKAIADRIDEYVCGSEFQLLETLAERLAALIMKQFGVPWLRLRLSKPGAIPSARAVGVEIERGNEDP